MSTIKFLGIESGFGEKHTNAFFENDKQQYFIDLSMTNITKAKELIDEHKATYVFITHLHADHVSGIPIFIQYMYYVKHKTVTFMVPEKIALDFKQYVSLSGITDDMYRIRAMCVPDVLYHLYYCPIRTYHCPELKSFGYRLNIYGTRVIYTGDTADFSPFEKYLIYTDEVYVDTSVNYGKVHLKLDEILEKFGDEPNFDVYLMHLDDIEKAKQMISGKKKYHIAELI